MRKCAAPVCLALLLAWVALTVPACATGGPSHSFQIEGVDMMFRSKGAQSSSSGGAKFLYFELVLVNRSSAPVSFDPGAIRVDIGGALNTSVYYDSLGSRDTQRKALPSGESRYALYFVFYPDAKLGRGAQWTLRDSGLRRP
jgi:hypothetical protein